MSLLGGGRSLGTFMLFLTWEKEAWIQVWSLAWPDLTGSKKRAYYCLQRVKVWTLNLDFAGVCVWGQVFSVVFGWRKVVIV